MSLAIVNHPYVFISSSQYFCLILTKFGISEHTFLQGHTNKFHVNLLVGAMVICAGRQADMMKLIGAFCN
jgi:hypothetical protein